MFQLLGTPTAEMWPGVTALPHFAPSFPQWPPQRLTKRIPQLADHDAGLDLVKVRAHTCTDVAAMHLQSPSTKL
jgi:hypothetical protein